jgi:hypothetical protein
MAFWILHNKWWKKHKSQVSNYKQIQISKFKTKGFIYKNNILNLTMKVIEVVYDNREDTIGIRLFTEKESQFKTCGRVIP